MRFSTPTADEGKSGIRVEGSRVVGRAEVVVAAEGVADARGGRRRKRGRRASPAASGRQPFCGTATSSGSLLFPPPPSSSPPSFFSSFSFSVSVRLCTSLIVSYFLVLPTSFGCVVLLFLSRSFSWYHFFDGSTLILVSIVVHVFKDNL